MQRHREGIAASARDTHNGFTLKWVVNCVYVYWKTSTHSLVLSVWFDISHYTHFYTTYPTKEH